VAAILLAKSNYLPLTAVR